VETEGRAGRVFLLKFFTVMENVVGRWDWMKERGSSREQLFLLPGNERANAEEHFTNDGRRERTL
jgi:hypothetical protein